MHTTQGATGLVTRLRTAGADFISSVRSGRLRRPAIALGVLLVVVAVLGFLVMPPVLRPLIEQQASQALGRPVTLGSLSINPFSLSATLRDLRVAEAQGDEAFLSVGEAYANVSSTSLFRFAPVLRELRVTKLQLHVVRQGDNQYNFNDLIERFAPKPDAPETPLPRFAVYNIQLLDGEIRFDDKLTGQQHRVDALQAGVPFISSLPGRVDTFVTPHLSASVNGSPFALEGEVKPFATHREAHLKLQLQPMDITRYLAYLPVKLPVALKQAELGSDLRVLWSEGDEDKQSLSVQGEIDLAKLKLAMPEGGGLLAFERLKISLNSFEPLAQPMRVDVARIELDAPQLSAERDQKGRLSFASLLTPPVVNDKPAAQPARSVPLPVLKLGELIVRGGGAHWQDAAVAGGYKGGVKDLALKLSDFDLAGSRKAALDMSMTGERGAKLSLRGTLQGVRAADLQARVEALPLGQYMPYLRTVVRKGDVAADVQGEAHLQVSREGDVTRIAVDGVRARLSELSLTEPGQRQPLLQVPLIELADVAVDMQEQNVTLGQFRSQGAKLAVVRDAKGNINILSLIRGEEVAEVAKEVVAEIRSKTWGFTVADASVADWSVALEDRSVKPAVRMQLDKITLGMKNVSNLGKALGDVKLSATVNRKGSASIDGQLGLAPLRGDVKLGMQAVDVLIAQPYVDDMYRVLITRGQAFMQGRAQFDLSDYDKPLLNYKGDVSLRDFNSLDMINDTDFLRWKSFAVRGMDLSLTPLKLTAREISLDSFYTRLILDQQGRFNLREIQISEEEAAKIAQATPATKAAPDYVVRVDKLVFDKGDVNFSDRFVKPNYDAHLLRVSGSVSGVSTDQASLATVAVTAALDGNAPVNVSGQLNPFRQDSYLDVKAKVSDVDLTGVSTYAAKYVGYGISRGKLSMTLDYKIRDRKLSAENQVFLDQLTFGEQVDSPEATKLPVKLGVALLKDSKGQIDINLPISGSLDDPEFSLGGIIWRVIGNLFSKAITSPFALIGSMFGGTGEELSYVDFAPGLANITPAAEEKLKSLSKALLDRPGLQLDITGRTDAAADTAGLKRAQLEGRLRAIKAERMVKRGDSVAEVDTLEISAAEREELLREAYKREKFEKPRNAIGMVRELPLAETEKMIVDHTEVTPAELQALASQRASGVRNWITSTGAVPSERVFLLNAGEDKSKQAPRVDFTLR